MQASILPLTDTIIELKLSLADLNSIKALTYLAISDDSTFLVLARGVIEDSAGILSEAILSSNPQQVSSFVQDHVRPSLETFDLDMNSGIITLYFSETVNSTSFDPTMVGLQSSENFVPGSTSIIFSGSELITLTPNRFVTFRILEEDLNEIKRLPHATSNVDTFLIMNSIAIFDVNDNRLHPITSVKAKQVSTYTPDTIPPHLDSFEFDLNQGTLSLYFNETVDVSTLSVQNIALSNMNIAQFLTSSNTVSDNSSVVVITLSEDDLNSIKLVPICTFSYAQ